MYVQGRTPRYWPTAYDNTAGSDLPPLAHGNLVLDGVCYIFAW
jgi:hypothetical protein